jgi:glyoxylase-like metal-dependent hydrolase (beta-lactamase superfamily II)
MKRAGALAAIVVVGLGVAGLVAQRGGIPPTGAIAHVRDNLYVIPGAGGNTTVFVTQTGVVLVDTKLASNGEAILKQVRTVTDRPVSMIINTHSHPDTSAATASSRRRSKWSRTRTRGRGWRPIPRWRRTRRSCQTGRTPTR